MPRGVIVQGGSAATLTVYYLGMPETTPEFPSEPSLFSSPRHGVVGAPAGSLTG